jgi:5,10-methylene-tetrahydrofolate dehydrogenase/methenyl tetrahydrofolate cyclohydrolase
MKLLYGNLLAQKLLKDLAKRTAKLAAKPQLHIISCRSDDLTKLYLKKKREAARQVFIETKVHNLPRSTTSKILHLIDELNQNPQVTGILVQVPLRLGLDLKKSIWAINTLEDVDGFQMREFRPPTPAAILTILSYYGVDFVDKRIHIIGQGFLVGRPLSILSKKAGVKTTVSDSRTPRSQLANLVSQADIIVSACGRQNTIDPEWLGKHQILIDAGITIRKPVASVSPKRNQGGVEVRGDIYSKEIAQRVRAITPVPGGVGPVAVAKLMENVYQAAISQMIQRK